MRLWKRILGWLTHDPMVVSPPAVELPATRSNPPVKCPRCGERTTGKLFPGWLSSLVRGMRKESLARERCQASRLEDKNGARMRKLKALLQWFILLDLQEHGHWCPMYGEYRLRDRMKRTQCPHHGYRWECTGIFCANVEQKDCPTCVEYEKRADFADALQQT
jgi:hypothetical protein